MLKILISNVLANQCFTIQIFFKIFNKARSFIFLYFLQNIKPLLSYFNGKKVSALFMIKFVTLNVLDMLS
jgi:hypothetical protein